VITLRQFISSQLVHFFQVRLWASVGWGSFAPVAGAVFNERGLHTCFMIFTGIYGSAALVTVLIPAQMLSSRSLQQPPKDCGFVPVIADAVHQVQPTHAEGEGPAAPPAIVIDLDDASKPGLQARQSYYVTAAGSPENVAALEIADASKTEPAPLQLHLVADAISLQYKRSASCEHAVTDQSAAITTRTGDGKHSDMSYAVQRSCQPKVAVDASATAGADQGNATVWTGLRKLINDVAVLAFFFNAFLMGVANGFIGYVFLLLTDLGKQGVETARTVDCLPMRVVVTPRFTSRHAHLSAMCRGKRVHSWPKLNDQLHL
jgi:hypothetical protein